MPTGASNHPPILRPAVVLLLVFTVICGGIYPLVVTLFAQGVFPHAANGSLIMQGEKAIGSELIGQQFTSPRYFWGRPSATEPPYNASASAASQMSPANPRLTMVVNERIARLQKADPGNNAPVPLELVTASASGLDPHITVDAAEYQARRVARARGLTLDKVMDLIEANTEGRQLGLLGRPRVNVLKLNLALDGK